MSASQEILLVAAGFAAGLVGSVAGLASLLSYLALLAVGLTPVAANVTSRVSLVVGGIGSALGSGIELRGQSLRLRRLGLAAAVGGAVGAGLLLVTPASAFEAVVPVLVAGAGVLVLAAPAPDELAAQPPVGAGPWLTAGIFRAGIYGGCFGAAAGVMMLAMLLLATGGTTLRAVAAKNVLLGLCNGVAALGFVLLGPVDWAAVLPLALGFLAGGRTRPVVARRAPVRPLRLLTAVTGLGLAAYLAADAWT